MPSPVHWTGDLLVGRNHPAVKTISDAVIAGALISNDPNFRRAGAVFTDTVSIRTVVLVLRLRYLLEEVAQQFAEEVVLAAFQRGESGIEWLEPLQWEGLRLLAKANVTANMPEADRQRNVEWALSMLKGDWYRGITEERSKALSDSHARLRKLVTAPKLKVRPHTPPDILGCYVLVPRAGGR